MKRFILIVLCLLLLPVYASTWVQIGDNSYIDKDNIRYYVNDYGNTDFYKKSFWIKLYNDNSDNFKEYEKISDKKIKYIIYKNIIDFNKNSSSIKSTTMYDENGNVIHSYTYKDYEIQWNSIIPDTIGEMWYELVKHPRMLKKIYKQQQNYNK